jgi:hypothetical protein
MVTALAALASTSSAASRVRQQNGGSYTYIVFTSGDSNISGTCGGLWGNLKRFPACAASAIFSDAIGPGNDLQWRFNTNWVAMVV